MEVFCHIAFVAGVILHQGFTDIVFVTSCKLGIFLISILIDIAVAISAVYLNGQYGMGIDVERTSMCQESSTADKTQKKMANVDELIIVLKENGFDSAAEFIEKKI